MEVLKFGGSSLADVAAIELVVSIVEEKLKTERLVVVISAMAGVTDSLLDIGTKAATHNESYKISLKELESYHLDTARKLLPIHEQSAILSVVKQKFNELEALLDGVYLLNEISTRTQDTLVSYGEVLSSLLVAAKFSFLPIASKLLDPKQIIVTNSNFSNAAVNFASTYQRCSAAVSDESKKLFIVPGFIAANELGQTTTLGRGGSDYTAALFAAAVKASALEIWTDVSGMMTADPRIVSHAKPIEHISYQEAMELSHFGAKIIYPPTILPVMQAGIPVRIKNTFEQTAVGTLIENVSASSYDFIRGISSINNIALLSLEGNGMVGIPGFSKRLFETLATAQINVILITQSSSEHSICVGVKQSDAAVAKSLIDATFATDISNGYLDPLAVETGLSVVAVVGENMKSHPGVSGKMFGTLGRNGINVRAIAQGSSEKNITAVLSERDVKKAVNVLHETFFETTHKQLNVFIAGVGNVGGKLVAQIAQQFNYLQENFRLQIRIVGLANSKQFLIQEEGIDLTNWKESLANAPLHGLNAYVQAIREKNLRNSVFVDVTANKDVAMVYASLLEKSIAVVACNKIACSSDYASYIQLKSLARLYNTSFLFETNVGAGLPVIGTLNDLLSSGDQITKIEAVLSGTLNFVFNNYDGTKPFADVVRQAQIEGYTEPDPRLDLGGTDVIRKIMILARESGKVIEMEDIANECFLPMSCFEGSVEDFYKEMLVQEAHFKNLYDAAAAVNCKLKFVASYEIGKAKVGLQHIAPTSDFYHLYGKDNLVLFYSVRYPEQPLVVKGAGAGAEVTASGVFADLIRTARV
ncbi:MAG: bifunctional aspartate kinase/homoserine dehydrogenase I [Bacteroidetes bacterium]|nr:bifunctional aspartate kinase/homoserine dehydrogenase I [Bacteroidota bacterium]